MSTKRFADKPETTEFVPYDLLIKEDPEMSTAIAAEKIEPATKKESRTAKKRTPARKASTTKAKSRKAPTRKAASTKRVPKKTENSDKPKTKMEICLPIFAKHYGKKTRQEILAMFQNEAGCTEAGSSTYFQTLKKAHETS